MKALHCSHRNFPKQTARHPDRVGTDAAKGQSAIDAAVAMENTIQTPVRSEYRGSPMRLGFVPLTDCAPVVMAEELGLYRRYSLNVQLSRELGWITVRDKILYGELDAAHAVAGMP